MSTIGPGDWVECVRGARSNFSWCPEEVVAGCLYRVTEVDQASDWRGNLAEGLFLQGFDQRHGWSVERFRPIYRPKTDLIESLKTPAKREHQPA